VVFICLYIGLLVCVKFELRVAFVTIMDFGWMDGQTDRPRVLVFRILHVWFLVHAAGLWYNIIHGSEVQTQDK
jgi:hypothetical protein